MKADGLKTLMDYSDLLIDAVCIVDEDGNFLHVSPAFQRIFDYQPAEVIGSNMIDLVLPDDREKTLQVVDRLKYGEPQTHFENRYLRKDGQIVHVMWAARWSPEYQVRIAVARDITNRKRSELLQTALYNISEAAHNIGQLNDLFVTIHTIINELLPADSFLIALKSQDDNAVVIPYYRNYARQPLTVTEWQKSLIDKVIDRQEMLLLTPDEIDSIREDINNVCRSEIGYWVGVPLQSRDHTLGALILESGSDTIRHTEKDAELLDFVSQQIATALERQRNYARIQHMALHDPLTGLPNLTLLRDRLETALIRAKRQGTNLALLYLDLNGFKAVNDRFGHATGDQLLIKVAERLSASLRKADTVSRIGGDEFVILLENIAKPGYAEGVADKISGLFQEAYVLGEESLFIMPSMGISIYPDSGLDADSLLRKADEAMYIEKRAAQEHYDKQLYVGE